MSSLDLFVWMVDDIENPLKQWILAIWRACPAINAGTGMVTFRITLCLRSPYLFSAPSSSEESEESLLGLVIELPFHQPLYGPDACFGDALAIHGHCLPRGP